MKLKRIYLRPEFWLGLMVLIGGIVHLLQKYNLSPAAILQTYWPVLFIITGIAQISSPRYRDLPSNLLLIFIGLGLLAYNGGFLAPQVLDDYLPDSLRKLLSIFLNSANWMLNIFNSYKGVLQ
ncbi:MAG: hypothetical protein HUU32_09230 [Calditrichaceae bacterium]|nr:hypothetical protein [Calditrichia bacterium]NUQ41561.1 hypothetical protein [Calditrichaceae bacterium]